MQSKSWTISPLISHWRFTKVQCTNTLDTCKKGEPDNENKFVFCYHNQTIDDKLIYLHTIQRSGNKDVQRDIDRYLICCRDVRFSDLILPRHCIPHYDNLPDIFYYAVGILDSNLDSEIGLQQVLLLLRQCIPLRRRTKRAQREVQWKQESMFSMQTLVRCIQGTLLGLYPTSLSNIAFGARIGIFTFLRTLLVQKFDTLQKAVNKISYIIKVCIMEYLCNVIIDYFPGICHTLNQSGQKVEHFCNTVSSICDIFRSELNTLYCTHYEKSSKTNEVYHEIILQIIPQLEKTAHSYFERCTRAYRGIIIGNTVQCKHIELTKKMLNSDIIKHITNIINNIYFTSNQNIFDMVHANFMNPQFIPFAWHLSKIINVYPLPLCIIHRQINALAKRYGGDTTCMEKCRMLHVCLICVIKRGGAHGMRLRHDCQTGELLCVNCDKGTVLSIDTLGRLVTIGNDNIILSSCCGTFIHYCGTGFDFCTTCGMQCLHNRQVFKKKERTSSLQKSIQEIGNESTLTLKKNSKFQRRQREFLIRSDSSHAIQESYLCELCTQKNIVQTISILDKNMRKIDNVRLCQRHSIPANLADQILEKDDLMSVLSKMSYSKRHSYHQSSTRGNSAAAIKSKRGRKPKFLMKD